MKPEYFYPLLAFFITFSLLMLANFFVGVRDHLRERREWRDMCSRQPVYFPRLHRWWQSRKHRRLFPDYRCDRPCDELTQFTEDCSQRYLKAVMQQARENMRLQEALLDKSGKVEFQVRYKIDEG